MNKKVLTILCTLVLLVSVFAVAASALANVASVGDQYFTSLENAIAEADGKEFVKLLDDATEISVAEGEVLMLDLNGNTVTTLENNGDVVVMDSATLSFDAADAGRIASVSGNGTLEANSADGVAYLMDTTDGYTFHAVDMSINNAGVYTTHPGIEYICDFKADSVAADKIDQYGVAVSVTAEPSLDGNSFADHCAVTTLESFAAGATGNAGKSTRITNILKESYSYQTNSSYSNMQIYGKSYVKLTTGEYVLGEAVCYSFRDIMGSASSAWETSFNDTGRANLLKIYEKFPSVLNSWDNIPNIKAAYETKLAEEKAEFLAKEDKVLKILTLGHSLAVDCGHMLAKVIATEGIPSAYGYDEVVVSTLYKSGCTLKEHVNFITNNEASYSLYLSSTKTPDAAPEIIKSVTMDYALGYDYWDIIIMQGGVFEIAKDSTYQNGNIETIQKFVKLNLQNPKATFAWHMTWANPEDATLQAKYPYSPNYYENQYKNKYENRAAFYNDITASVQRNILTNDTFKFVIPTGTAMENALSSYLEETDLHRDYVHATDKARLMNSYLWYCKLFDIKQLDEIKIDAIPETLAKSIKDTKDLALGEGWKNVILESVNNALTNPFQMTQSVYTEAPAA